MGRVNKKKYLDIQNELEMMRKELKATRICSVLLSICCFVLCFGLCYVTTSNNSNQINGAVSDFQTYVQQFPTFASISDLDKAITTINTLSNSINSLIENDKTTSQSLEKYESEMSELKVYMDDLSQTLNDVIQNNTKQKANLKIDNASTNDISNDIIEVEDEGIPSSSIYTNGVLSTDGTIPKSYFDSVVSYYNTVPSIVRDYFVQDGWVVRVVSSELHINGITSRILALTNYDERTIYISNRDASSVVHEMGHYIDWRTNCSDTIQGIYNEELNGFLTINGSTHSHNYVNLEEYFAESFSLYVLKNDELKQYCPKTHDYIRAILGE